MRPEIKSTLPELCVPVEHITMGISHETDEDAQGRHSVLTHNDSLGLFRHNLHHGVNKRLYARVCLSVSSADDASAL